MIRIIIAFFFFAAGNTVAAQHIQYREKDKPLPKQEVKPAVPKDSAVAEIITPHNECPGMDASLPVCMNYVPPEIVNKFKVKFEGHCYAITTLKKSLTETQYKLRICYHGEFVERFVDVNGVIFR